MIPVLIPGGTVLHEPDERNRLVIEFPTNAYAWAFFNFARSLYDGPTCYLPDGGNA